MWPSARHSPACPHSAGTTLGPTASCCPHCSSILGQEPTAPLKLCSHSHSRQRAVQGLREELDHPSQLCDLAQVPKMLWASVSSSVQWA